MAYPIPSLVNNPGPLAVAAGSAHDTQFNNSRLMSDNPHIDGVAFYGAEDLGVVSTATLPVLTRVVKGEWALQRTAAAAETLYFRIPPSDLGMRLGELFSFGETNKGSTNPTPGSNYPPGTIGPPGYEGKPATGAQAGGLPFPKGVLVTDIFVVYINTIVALTTATLRFGYTQFQNNVVMNQVDVVPATAIALPVQANPYVQLVAVPSANQLWMNADLTQWEIEFNAVMANTGVLQVIGLGFHYMFNWT